MPQRGDVSKVANQVQGHCTLPYLGGKRMQYLPCGEGSSPELCQTRAPCGIERRSMSNAITAMQGLMTDEAPTKGLTLNALR
jgi:hypothetical protein